MYGIYESQEHYEHEMGAGEAEAQAAYAYEEYLKGLLEAKEYDLWALETCAERLQRDFPDAANKLRRDSDAIVEARKPKASPVEGSIQKEIEDDLPF
jgi:hypothetical protein